jgi:Gpi18-like mannosyltransferase
VEKPKHLKYSFIIAIVLLGASIVARVVSFPVQTIDYTDSLVPWFRTLHDAAGLTAFQYPFSDYSPLYLYIIKLLTFVPIYSLYTIKSVSVIFDIFLSFIVYKIVRELKGSAYDRDQYFLVFAITFAIPTVLVNSSLWGQCDAAYASFALLSLLFIMRDRPFSAALYFGIAVCFKLQAIFFLPVLAGYLLSNRTYAKYILAVPTVYLASIIPAVLGGGSFWRYLTIYFTEAGEYSALSLSAPSVYAFVNSSAMSITSEAFLTILGAVLALTLAVSIGSAVARKAGAPEADRSPSLLFLALLSVTAMPFLLPHMHERYFFMADVLSVAYTLYNPRKWYIALLIVAASFFSYLSFLAIRLPQLSGLVVNEAFLGLIELFAIICILLSRKSATSMKPKMKYGVPGKSYYLGRNEYSDGGS